MAGVAHLKGLKAGIAGENAIMGFQEWRLCIKEPAALWAAAVRLGLTPS